MTRERERGMRYHLLWHIREEELAARSPEWHEEVAAFLVTYSGELASTSELDWRETYAPESRSHVVGPGGETREGHYNEDAKPVHRVWAVRVSGVERALEIAGRLAGELDTWVEVREVLEAAHRP